MAATFFEPVRIVSGLQNIAVVGQSIEKRRGHFGISEDLHPFSEGGVGGDNRARREWQWLCQEIGENVVRATIAALPGNRRPYPLNIAKALDVILPPEDKLPQLHKPADESVMNAALAQARQTLRKG